MNKLLAALIAVAFASTGAIASDKKAEPAKPAASAAKADAKAAPAAAPAAKKEEPKK